MRKNGVRLCPECFPEYGQRGPSQEGVAPRCRLAHITRHPAPVETVGVRERLDSGGLPHRQCPILVVMKKAPPVRIALRQDCSAGDLLDPIRPYRLVWSLRLANFIPSGRRSWGMSRQLPPGGINFIRSRLSFESAPATWLYSFLDVPRTSLLDNRSGTVPQYVVSSSPCLTSSGGRSPTGISNRSECL